MKQEKIIVWSDILATQMNHWTLFSIAAMASIIAGVTTPPVALWLFSGLVPVFFFFIRRYTNTFAVMALSHTICLALFFFLPFPNFPTKVMFCLYGIGLFINSFIIRLRTKERLDEAISPPVAVGIIAVSLFALYYQERPGFDVYYIAMAAIYFIGYYIRYYLQHYLYFMTVNANSTGYIPHREVFASGLRLTGIFSFFAVILLILFSDIGWLSELAGQLKNGIIWLREHGVFAWLASLFEEEYEPITNQGNNSEPLSSGFMPLEMGEPGLFWVALEKVTMTVVPIVIACLLCFALFQFIKMVKEIFRKKRMLAEETDGESIRDIRETYEVKKEKGKQKDLFAFLSPAERIRRIYKQRIWTKRTVLAAKGNVHPLHTYTARECGLLLSENELAAVYEKARYSNAKCTRDDVKRASVKNGTAG